MFQGFGLANALEWGTLDLLDESIDALEDFAVRALPIEIIFPGVLGENEFHSTSSRSIPPPDSNSAIDSRSRRAFFGLRKRYAVSSKAW
jgi:hypothetical protein